MPDQMKLLSGEVVPTGPGTPTNSNSVQVQQIKTIGVLGFVPHLLISVFCWFVIFMSLISRSDMGGFKRLSTTSPEYNVTNIGGRFPNIYEQNFSFDLHVFISENETNLARESELVWKKSKLTYGDLQSVFNKNVSISENTRNNDSLYLHACVTKSDFPVNPKTGDSWAELYTFCKTKRLNIYWEPNGGDPSASQVRSCWRPNWTVNLVGDGGGGSDKDPLTSKFYPALYLNDNFNLARDCIAVDQTTEWLPLNLSFKQIGTAKLKQYLRQPDYEYYFKRSSVPYEELIRRNLIASDFETTGVIHIEHFLYILAAVLLAVLLAKSILFAWAGFVPFNASAILFTYFYIALLPVIPFIVPEEFFETEKSEDSPKENERGPSTEVPYEWTFDGLLNFLRLESWVIFRNLAVLLLVHLLCLYLGFFLGHVAFSAQELLDFFYRLALLDCMFYLVSTFLNINILVDCPVPIVDSSEPIRTKLHMFLDVVQIAAYSHAQLVALFAMNNFYFVPRFFTLFEMNHFYLLAAFSTPAFLVFIFVWLLSDLASWLCMFELGNSIRKLKKIPRSKLD